MNTQKVSQISDSQILPSLERLHQLEVQTQAEFLFYLALLEERKLFAREGYSSLFSFLVERFHYSESSALRRIQVSRIARRFPRVYNLLADGELSLRHLQVLAPCLSSRNCNSLFDLAIGKSVRELQVALAAQFPRPESADRVAALSADRYQIQFTVDQAFLDKLRHALALLGRKHPSGRLEFVLGDALDLLLESEGGKQCRPVLVPAQAKMGITQDDLDENNAKFDDPYLKNTPRYIPRGIRRQVWARDLGRCQYPRKSGGVCGETRFLEFDHVYPWAWGGSSKSAQNIRLLCRAHNQATALSWKGGEQQRSM